MSLKFSLRSRIAMVWLIAIVLAAMALAFAFPPAFWLCTVGVGLLVVGLTMNSARTGQWYSWQLKGSLSLLEGFVALAGVGFVAIPFLVILVRSWLA